MKRGRLLVFEGLDGCGKTTQAARLAERLRGAGYDVLETREPSDGPHGRRIRQRARSDEPVPAEEELAWFVADRREHVDRVIEPALAAGRVVVCDRYTLSSVAYQGAAGLDPGAILEQGEADFPVPDLVLLLEIDARAGLGRVRGRGAALETRFEERERLERVADIFRGLDRDYIERIDADAPPDAVHDAVVACVRRRLGLV